jgi:hypothetical protein
LVDGKTIVENAIMKSLEKSDCSKSLHIQPHWTLQRNLVRYGIELVESRVHINK